MTDWNTEKNRLIEEIRAAAVYEKELICAPELLEEGSTKQYKALTRLLSRCESNINSLRALLSEASEPEPTPLQAISTEHDSIWIKPHKDSRGTFLEINLPFLLSDVDKESYRIRRFILKEIGKKLDDYLAFNEVQPFDYPNIFINGYYNMVDYPKFVNFDFSWQGLLLPVLGDRMFTKDGIKRCRFSYANFKYDFDTYTSIYIVDGVHFKEETYGQEI